MGQLQCLTFPGLRSQTANPGHSMSISCYANSESDTKTYPEDPQPVACVSRGLVTVLDIQLRLAGTAFT